MKRVSSPARRTQVERTDATRAALIAAARTLFERQGFAATGTPEIVAAANVTRGALYHHFADKTELFHAVAQQVAQEVADGIEAGSRAAEEPLAALLTGARAYFATMAEAGRARLLLLEAPAVLSAEQVMVLNEQAGFDALHSGLLQALGPRAEQMPVRALAELLSAMFDRAALAVARGGAVEEHERAVRLLMTGLVRG
jgi:AcrR family transcriptional regulator